MQSTAVLEREPSQVSEFTQNISTRNNPYRAGSNYALCFDCVVRLGSERPVSREALLKAYMEASGKDARHARYDLGIILSPTQDGRGHRSSKKYAYWVERLYNGYVRIHLDH